jgi:hypothetical protein
MAAVNVVVETDMALPVARALLAHVGLAPGLEIECGGRAQLDQHLPIYSAAAMHTPWLVLRELGHDLIEPAALKQHLAQRPGRRLCLGVAVHAVEAWLLADAASMARFLQVPIKAVPKDPDDLFDPRRALVDLARRSSKPAIRADMVPGKNAARPVGPGYEARIMELASTHWRPELASAHSPSLQRCIDALHRLASAVAS